MGVMICLGQGGLRSLSASSFNLFFILFFYLFVKGGYVFGQGLQVLGRGGLNHSFGLV